MAKYETTKCYNLIKKHFDDDANKTQLWFTTINSSLGCKPIDMLRLGRGSKLLQFIESHIDGYFP